MSLKDGNFTSASLVGKEPEKVSLFSFVSSCLSMLTDLFKGPLKSYNEITYNSVWRFLTLREYIDASHNLTPWGEVLAATIAALAGKKELEEPAVIAIELLRLGLLNADNMFQYSGAPMRGTGMSTLPESKITANLQRC